eukprot:GHVO01006384.1.p1 GENE.GHVO01006384.1~~GHVO01006384.1.p1  ORF type:complete len:103 (+),score=0.49 GHVO01006384.1:59-367(+)
MSHVRIRAYYCLLVCMYSCSYSSRSSGTQPLQSQKLCVNAEWLTQTRAIGIRRREKARTNPAGTIKNDKSAVISHTILFGTNGYKMARSPSKLSSNGAVEQW